MSYKACEGTLAQPGYKPCHVHSTTNKKCCKHCQQHKSWQTTLEPCCSSLIHKAERSYKQLLKTMPLSHQERQFFQEQDLPQQCCFISNMSGARGGERGGQLAHCIAPASSLLGFREAQREGRWCWSNRATQGLICKSSTALTTAKVQERPWYVQEPQWAPGLEGSLPLPCSQAGTLSAESHNGDTINKNRAKIFQLSQG